MRRLLLLLVLMPACRTTADLNYASLGAPATVSVVPVLDGVLVDWSLVEGATSYVVFAATSSGTTSVVVAAPPVTLTSAASFSVAARRGARESDASSALQARPIARGWAGLVPALAPDWTVTGANSRFAAAVELLDGNGDGRDDVLIGEPNHDGGQTDEGRVLLYVTGSDGRPAATPKTAESNVGGVNFGAALRSVGDLDADGREDFVAGLPATTLQGSFVLVRGSADGFSQTSAQVVISPQTSDRFGSSFAIGDVDGDGLPDLAVGAPQRNSLLADEGAIAIHGGLPGGTFTNDPVALIRSGDTGALLGLSVAIADLDDDGLDDLIGGAPGFGAGDEGAIFTLRGRVVMPGNMYVATDTFVSPDIAGETFGVAATRLGTDVLISGEGSAQEGALYQLSGLLTLAGPIAKGQDTDSFGRGLAVGDVNGDGYDDILVGAWLAGLNDAGAIHLFLGDENGFQTSPSWTALGPSTQATFGFAVATGDVDADGSDDVLVGFPSVGFATPEGASLFYGPSTRGPAAWAGNARSVCTGTLVSPQGATAQSKAACAWNWGDSGESDVDCATLDSLAHTYVNAGVFHPTLRVTNAHGVMSLSATTIDVTSCN